MTLKPLKYFCIIIATPVVLALLLIGTQILYSTFAPGSPALNSVTAETFKFEDYGYGHDPVVDLNAALHKLFPAGTPKAYVDAVLVKRNFSTEDDSGFPTRSEVIYHHKGPLILISPCGVFPGTYWNVVVHYNRDLKLTGLFPVGPCH